MLVVFFAVHVVGANRAGVAREKREPRRCNLPNIRCTQQERDIIEQNAKHAGQRMSRYVRDMALQVPDATAVAPPASVSLYSAKDLAALHALAKELRRIGVNLNQIARKANETGIISASLDNVCAETEQTLDMLLAKVMP